MYDSIPDFGIEECKNNVIGYYNYEKDYIALDDDLIGSGDGYYVLSVLEHELYHRYEHYQVLAYEALKDNGYENLANLNLLANASEYEKEFENYTNSAENIEAYEMQLIETDCDDYVNSGVLNHYYDACREYYQDNDLDDMYSDAFYESSAYSED